MLSRLSVLTKEATAAYRVHGFSRVYSLLQRFVAVECSNFYLDIAKDRWAVEGLMSA
jgi:isoleucyl-tRNA synthetase